MCGKENCKNNMENNKMAGWAILSFILLLLLFMDILPFLLPEMKYKNEVMDMLGDLLAVIGVMSLCGSTITRKEVFRKKETIRPRHIVYIMGAQAFVDILWFMFNGIEEKIVNFFGYTAIADANILKEELVEKVENVENGSFVMLVISLAIVAPLVEEIINRGYVLSLMEKQSRHYAVVISAFLFSLMHSNIEQLIHTFLAGLILGYVAQRFSLWWAIISHAIDNAFFALFASCLQNAYPEFNILLFYDIFILLAILVFLLRKDNKWDERIMDIGRKIILLGKDIARDKGRILLTFPTILFILRCILVIINRLEPLG